MSTGKVTDKLGRTFDLTLIENANHLEAPLRGPQHAGARCVSRLTLDVGATYTLSHAWGNVDGEIGGARVRRPTPACSTRSTNRRRGTILKAIWRSISGIARGSG